MTDLEKMIKAFDELGVKYRRKGSGEIREVFGHAYDIALKLGGYGDNANEVGFGGFYGMFYFLHGKYVTFGAWE